MPQDDSNNDVSNKANSAADGSTDQQLPVTNDTWRDPLLELMDIESKIQNQRSHEATESNNAPPLETQFNVAKLEREDQSSQVNPAVSVDTHSTNGFTSLFLERSYLVVLLAVISLVIAIIMIQSALEPSGVTVVRNEQEDLSQLLLEAQQHQQAGRLVAPYDGNALALYQNVLNRIPEQPDAIAGIESIKNQLLQLAENAEANQQWDTARSHLEAILTIDPNHARALSKLDILSSEKNEQEQLSAWLAQAERHLQAGKLVEPLRDNALALFQQVLEHKPGHARALAGIEAIKTQILQRAVDAQSQQQWDTARSHLETILVIDPNNTQAISNLDIVSGMKNAQEQLKSLLAQAQDHLQSGQLTKPEQDNALSIYRQVLNRHPGNRDALTGVESIKKQLLRLAEDAQSQQKWDTVRSHLEAILNIDPNHTRALSLLGTIQAKLDPQENIDLSEIENILIFGKSESVDNAENPIVDEEEILNILAN